MSSLPFDKYLKDTHLMAGVFLTLILEGYRDVLKYNSATVLYVKLKEAKAPQLWELEFRVQLDVCNKVFDFTLKLAETDYLTLSLVCEHDNWHHQTNSQLNNCRSYLEIKREVFEALHDHFRYLFDKVKRG